MKWITYWINVTTETFKNFKGGKLLKLKVELSIFLSLQMRRFYAFLSLMNYMKPKVWLSCRMSEGGALTALSIWLNNMQEMFMTGEDLPELASVVVV